MSKGFNCAECGGYTAVCYTDGGGLAMVHGQCLCRECYIKDGHPECPHCKKLTAKGWRFCCHCGGELRKETAP